MRKIHLSLLLSIVAFFATGCPKYKPPVDFNNPNSFVNKIDLNARLKTLQDRYWCYRFGFDYKGGADPCSGSVENGPEKAKALRNEFIETTIPYIDDNYTNYITGLQSGRDRDNFILDVVELGTSAAIGITKGERSIQILGVALTAFRGGRRSADLNFYKEQTTPILISKMDGNRARIRATILTREKANVDDYPIGAAIADIVEYYNAGTLVRAFTELQKDTAVQTKQSENEVLELKGVPLSPAATPEEAELTRDSQKILGDLQIALADPNQQAEATANLRKIITALEKQQDTSTVLKIAEVTAADDGDTLLKALVKIRRNLRRANPPNIDLLNKVNQAIVENGQ